MTTVTDKQIAVAADQLPAGVTGMTTVTDKQINDWKEKHGEIFAIDFEGEDNQTIVGYFRKPNRVEMNYISTFHNQPFKMQEQLVKACFLGGDTRILHVDGFMLGAAQALNELLEVKRGELKKL
ncbi:hypothetical protein DYU11_18490 [Fibrisoma montanum]|uniref:Uncharacterized protein n=1 Tax=Fibrisoma montanum TaxID=2305895 RepID=A0A418M6L0_9BACT|nr:hypothetical protein [Fibrisoma montanum]RIV21395.1 hypothetical protein DYU11_18490 [Fibrisoma montanum]